MSPSQVTHCVILIREWGCRLPTIPGRHPEVITNQTKIERAKGEGRWGGEMLFRLNITTHQ